MPVQIPTLVSSAVKWGDHNSRADRENRKLELFRVVGRMIKEGLLRRIARNFIILTTPEERTRHQEVLAKSIPPVDFPKPNVRGRPDP